MILYYPILWFQNICTIILFLLVLLVILFVARIVANRFRIIVLYNILNSILNLIGNVLIKITEMQKYVIENFVKGK